MNGQNLVTEGVHLYNIGIDPYSGDLFHETPLGLVTFDFIQKHFSINGIWILFIMIDLTTAHILGITAKFYIEELVRKLKYEYGR